MTYRILIDQDSVLYDLSSPWYGAHNKDYPDHHLKAEDITGWNTQQVCDDNNCTANIYSYFDNPDIWSNGDVLGNSNEITREWLDTYKDIELGILTTAANAMSMPHKIAWLQKHFPHIKNIMVVYKAHIKHWVSGDILIDDGLHNVENFTGIRILYGQPWNNNGGEKYLRVDGNNDHEKWLRVDMLVRRAILLLDNGYNHRTVENILKDQKVIKWE